LRLGFSFAGKADLRQTAKAQGLKPIDSIELIGTTEVVPFHKAILLNGLLVCLQRLIWQFQGRPRSYSPLGGIGLVREAKASRSLQKSKDEVFIKQSPA
jgi:hypothetical protein